VLSENAVIPGLTIFNLFRILIGSQRFCRIGHGGFIRLNSNSQQDFCNETCQKGRDIRSRRQEMILLIQMLKGCPHPLHADFFLANSKIKPGVTHDEFRSWPAKFGHINVQCRQNS
jgi:hypothetical protein